MKTATRNKHTPLNEGFSLAMPLIGGADVEDTTLGEVLADRKSLEPQQQLDATAELRRVVNTVVCDLTEIEVHAIIGPANGESYKQIAERTGLSEKQIDNARQRGKSKLSKALAA